MFLFGYNKKSVVENVLGMTEPAELVKNTLPRKNTKFVSRSKKHNKRKVL
ncbi:MAG: hypothetical protein PG981_000724 [Wolbachia endosymbiont of Ctenocephalides orientis wCori]|nr:MAG: hypothetical protein PG981_000724 [Wolbachia endosymbiont of Ctenocephalides orientis wCori]